MTQVSTKKAVNPWIRIQELEDQLAERMAYIKVLEELCQRSNYIQSKPKPEKESGEIFTEDLSSWTLDM
jgi:hypothetical protein